MKGLLFIAAIVGLSVWFLLSCGCSTTSSKAMALTFIGSGLTSMAVVGGQSAIDYSAMPEGADTSHLDKRMGVGLAISGAAVLIGAMMYNSFLKEEKKETIPLKKVKKVDSSGITVKSYPLNESPTENRLMQLPMDSPKKGEDKENPLLNGD